MLSSHVQYLLCLFEYKFCANHTNVQDKGLLEILQHSYRYMDDLLSINNRYFSQIMQEMYPMDSITTEPSFLKTLEVENSLFVTKTKYLNLEISLTSPYTGLYNVRYT